MPSSKPIRVAIAGYGIVGPLHALVYRNLNLLANPPVPVELALIVDPSEPARARAAREHPVPVAPTLVPHAGDLGIDILDCCTDTPSHFEICKQALQHGLSVFCEKPLTGSPDQSRELVRLADRLQLKLGVNFNFRFIPAIQEAKRRIDAGELGELRSVRVEYHRSSNIKRWGTNGLTDRSPSRSALMDLGPHAIDMVHFLAGTMSHITARSLHFSPHAPRDAPFDLTELTCVVGSNAIGSVLVSKITPGASNDLSVVAVCTGATLHFHSQNPNEFTLSTEPPPTRVHRHIVTNRGDGPATALIPVETTTSILHTHAGSIAAFLFQPGSTRTGAASGEAGLGVDIVLESARINQHGIPSTSKTEPAP